MNTLLEETLKGEISETYRVDLYSKVNSCEMFSYHMSENQFGNFGKNFGLGTGYADELDLGEGVSVFQRFRADGSHRGYGPHVNMEIFSNPIRPNNNGKILPLINDHLDFNWKK